MPLLQKKLTIFLFIFATKFQPLQKERRISSQENSFESRRNLGRVENLIYASQILLDTWISIRSHIYLPKKEQRMRTSNRTDISFPNKLGLSHIIALRAYIIALVIKSRHIVHMLLSYTILKLLI